jgi:hypothetical protein
MRYCGREFSVDELKGIEAIIGEDPQGTRTGISQQVCRALGWYKPDGGLKEMSCRVALLRMQRAGLIVLPPPRKSNANGKPYARRSAAGEPRLPIVVPAQALGALQLHLVGTRQESALWNEYVARYHYLGFKPLPGAQLRYLARYGGEELALASFSASAWKLAARDRFIGWSDEQRQKNLHLVINNSRFLILPWVQGRNLASRLLSQLCRRLRDDWEQSYGYQPALVETFVECGRFLGTSYKAANWVLIGETQGRGRMDRHTRRNLPKKAIWLYPLVKEFRQILCS